MLRIPSWFRLRMPASKGGKAGAAAVVVGAVMAAAAAFIAPHEGLFTKAYLDPVGVPTICYGHIEGVRLGQTMTAEECKQLLATDLPRYDKGMLACLKRPITDPQHVAFLSFIYNVGIGGFCKSTLVRLHNAGAPRPEVCRELRKWDKARDRRTGKWKTLPGLTKRRANEEAMCLRDALPGKAA